MSENKNPNDQQRFYACSRKRAAATEFLISCLADYFENLYGKPFGYYKCEKFCGEYHLYSLKLETVAD